MCNARIVPLLLAFALASPLVAQPATSTPAGKVAGIVTIGDMPVPGATVTIAFGKETHTLVTEGDGRFVYAGIPLGAIVRISAEMSGMKAQKRSFALTGAAASRDFTFAMKMANEGMTAICAVGPSAIEEPNTYRYLQTDVDKLPIGRSPLAVLDLLPGTH